MKLNIYKASAGSGKTHILAGKFIVESFARKAPSRSGSSLYEAFKDTMAFARILAVTFTNKAAGEMKERILKELDKLAQGENSDYMADIIKRYPEYSPEKVRERARNIRTAILHNYTDFNLRTIDSFVQRVIRAFCYDINVSTGFSTQTDEAMVLNDLLEILLKKSDTDPELRSQFMAMAEKNVEDGGSWDFREQIKSLAKLIFTEKFKKMEAEVLGKSDEERRIYYKTCLEMVKVIQKDFEDKAEAISQETKEVFAAAGIQGKDINNNMKILQNFLENNILACEIKTTVAGLTSPDNTWMTKGQKPVEKKYIPELRPKLEALLSRAINLIEKESTDYFTAKAIRKDYHAFTFLGDLAKLMPEYRQENRMMLVSDATAFLNAIVEHNEAPFIYERVGNKFDHIYIDEFQDTSEFQWNNFKPLIENSLGQGFENMIVGDVKQAIYRFRGGDWSLLSSKVEKQIGAGSIQQNTLDTNWRSRKNIVTFNDAIFQKAVAILGLHDTDGLDLNLLAQIYSDSYQKLPPKANRTGGKVNVVFFNTESANSQNDDAADSGDYVADPGDNVADPGDNVADPETPVIMEGLRKYEQMALYRMAQEIDKLLKSGVKSKKICILVRRSIEGNLCVNYLMQYQQIVEGAQRYDIVSSDALFVRNSLTVTVLLNAMKYVNNNDDIIAQVEMLRAYCTLSGQNHTDDEIFKSAAKGQTEQLVPEGFKDIMQSYSDLPLYDLCEKIISCFNLQQYEGDTEYLRTFEDCVLNFTKTFSSDLNKFVNWWDESGYKTSIQPSDNQDAITVMTVHKSKGLDFSIQFIPFCNWKMEESSNLKANYILADTPKGSDFERLRTVPLKYSAALAKTHFADAYLEEKRNMNVDALNILYVALTRAVDELHIYCPKPKEKEKKDTIKISTVGDLMYHTITTELPNQNPDIAKLSEYFNGDTLELVMDEKHELNTGFRLKEYKNFNMKPFKNEPWESKLAVLSHSSEFFIQNSPFLQERINHGLFMHDVMSKIEYREDAPEVLQDMIYQGRITEAQRQELTRLLNEAFEIPQVGRWFSHEWKQVINERALLTKEGNIRIPDRVLVGDSETIVIDFKFGKEHDEYRDQIKEYASLLESMHHPNVKAYLYYVESKKIVEVE